MATITKASVKAYFETGDKPTQAQFVDFIDSYEDKSEILTAIASAATGGKLGIVRIQTASAVTVQAIGAVGIQLVDATATSSALNALGVGAVGRQFFESTGTASALNALGGGTVGLQLLGAAATASAQNALGAGAVGIQLLSAIVTASVQNQIALGTAATPKFTRLGLGGDASATVVLSVTQAGNAVAAQITNSDDDTSALRLDASHGTYGGNVMLVNAARAANAAYNMIVAYSGDISDAEFSVGGDGTLKSDQAASTPADYAEFFENKSKIIIPPGTTVAIVSGKVSAATGNPAKQIIGVVRPLGASAIVANSHWSRHHNKYERDKWGRYVLDGKGNRVLSESFDPKQTYVPRAQRPAEWTIVGLLGQVPLLKGQPTAPLWVKMRDIDATAEMWLVR